MSSTRPAGTPLQRDTLKRTHVPLPASVSRLPDRKLAALVRQGRLDAAQELWSRHAAYGFAVAEGLAPEDDWESISSRAWEFIMDSPSDSDLEAGWRPYLYLVIRAVSSAEPPGSAADAMLTSAFYDLPAASREVLWYGHVESFRPPDMAVLTGADARQIPGLLSQARKELRRQWVDRHVKATTKGSTCRWVWSHSEEYVTDKLGASDRDWFDQHLKTCAKCRPARSDAIDVASRLSKIVLPSVTGAGGAASLLSYIATNGPRARTFVPMPASLAEQFAAPQPPPAEPVAEEIEEDLADDLVPATMLGGDEEDVPAGPVTAARETSATPRGRTSAIVAFVVLGVIVVLLVTFTISRLGAKPTPPPVTINTATASATTAGTTFITQVDTGDHNNLFPIVSGKAEPGSEVVVRIGDTKMTVTADQTGHWDTTVTKIEEAPLKGQISAVSGADPAPALAAYEIQPAPVITYAQTGTTTTWTVAGVPDTGVQILVDGTIETTAILDEAGNGSPWIQLAPGTHFVQVRYAADDRVGASSTAISVEIR